MRRPTKIERKNPVSLPVHTPVRARIEMLRDAVISGSQEADALLSRAIRDRSPKVRATAAELIAKQKNAFFLGSLHDMLSDPSDLVRGEAIDALGTIEEGSGRHHEDLVLRLRDAKPLVRIAAIQSLALLQDFSSVPEMRPRLKDPDSLVRAYAAIALAELAPKTSLSDISKALGAEKDEAAAAGFMVALHLLGDVSNFMALLTLLSSTRYQVRCFVANWLPRLKLSKRELTAAKARVEEALARPLGRADASTMLSVRELLQ